MSEKPFLSLVRQPLSFDVIVMGGGPAGCVAAKAHALNPKLHILIIEANLNTSRRLAGEWLHPKGIADLKRLGLGQVLEMAAVTANHGFAVFPGPTNVPSILDYDHKRHAIGFCHHRLVSALREHVKGLPNVTFVENQRVSAIEGQTVSIEGSHKTWYAQAPLLIAADGRRSLGHRILGAKPILKPLSAMAGFLIPEVTLPGERRGHIFHAPGHLAIAYPVSDALVRVLMEVPTALMKSPLAQDTLAQMARINLPADLARGLAEAMARDGIDWNVNTEQPRRLYGRPGLYLIGDAVGVTHPLCASGLMLAIGDALATAEAENFPAYRRRRQRESRVPELLSMALYDVLGTQSPSAAVMRAAMHELWRSDPAFSALSMNLLGGDNDQMIGFLPPYIRTVSLAAKKMLNQQSRDLRLMTAAGEWLGLADLVRQASVFYVGQLTHMAMASWGFRPFPREAWLPKPRIQQI